MKFSVRIRPLAKQRGLALIMAVLIAALATSVVAFAAWRQQVRLRAAELQQESAQAQEIARATISIARVLLMQERKPGNASGVDYAEEEWSKPRQYEVERGKASGQLTDMQGKFNLNRLVPSNEPNSPPDEASIQVYRDLLQALRIDGSEALVDALVDWLDNDGTSSARPQGAEDEYYLNLAQPYRTANSPLSDLSDLLKVRGYTPEVVKTLQPHVAVFPPPVQDNHINVNLTTPELLSAFVYRNNVRLSLAEAKQIVDRARKEPYVGINDLWQKSEALQKIFPGGIVDMGSLPSVLMFSSNYFQLELSVEFGKVLWREQVLLYRTGDGSTTQVVWRKRIPD